MLVTHNEARHAGHHLAQLPVDAKVGKLLLLAATLGCLAPALTIAACLSYRTPFSAPFDQQDAAMHVKQALAAPGKHTCILNPPLVWPLLSMFHVFCQTLFPCVCL
jgi:HrpA-like RNA helicase